jgi:hypothetical protein
MVEVPEKATIWEMLVWAGGPEIVGVQPIFVPKSWVSCPGAFANPVD